VEAEKGSWRCGEQGSLPDLLPRLRQFAVAVGWHGGGENDKRAFASEGMGRYGAGGEQRAMVAWRGR